MIKTVTPILLAAITLTGCHPEVPIGIRPAATLVITSQNPQCKTFKSVLKSGSTLSFQATKSVGDETLLSFIYANYTPAITKTTDLTGVDSIEVSCTSSSDQVIKSAKPFTDTNRAYEFLFSQLAP